MHARRVRVQMHGCLHAVYHTHIYAGRSSCFSEVNMSKCVLAVPFKTQILQQYEMDIQAEKRQIVLLLAVCILDRAGQHQVRPVCLLESRAVKRCRQAGSNDTVIC